MGIWITYSRGVCAVYRDARVQRGIGGCLDRDTQRLAKARWRELRSRVKILPVVQALMVCVDGAWLFCDSSQNVVQNANVLDVPTSAT